jgi:hypothetical protein
MAGIHACAPAADPTIADVSSRRPLAVDWLLPVLSGVGAVWLLWHGLVSLPHQYDALAARGVPVRVQVVRCGVGQGSDSRGFGCTVRTDYEGRTHQWRVDRDVRAETGSDGEAAGLADPQDPGRSALTRDVVGRTGTGAPVIFFAAVAAAVCVVTTVVQVRRRRLWTGSRRPRRA